VKKNLLILFLIIFYHSAAVAAPAFYKSVIEPIELPGKTLHERFSPGIPSGFMLAPASYPTATINILFLRVEFQEDLLPAASQTTGSGLWKDYLYNGDPDFWVNRAQSKFVEYWKEVSYGLLPIHVDVSQKIYKLPHTMATYGNETGAVLEKLISDSIASATTDTVSPITTFSQFDAVLIVHAGVGQESAAPGVSENDIWSLYYNAGIDISPVTLRDGHPIREAIIMPQSDSRGGIIVDPLGVYAHEFGHWLGLPDLYCTGNLNCPGGVGDWSLMDHGSYNRDPATHAWYGSAPSHLDAWSLYYLGWVAPRIMPMSAINQSVIMNPVESAPAPEIPAQGMNVYLATASSGTTHQFYLMENRQPIGFDRGLPGQGLLVWLVDQDVITLKFPNNAINNDVTRPGLKLVEADGDRSLLSSGGDSGAPGDPFPGTTGNHKLSPMTNPPSQPYTNYGLVNLRNIHESAGNVSFEIGFAPLPPDPNSIATDPAAKTVTWPPSMGAVSYTVYKNGTLLQSDVPASSSPPFRDTSLRSTDIYVIVAKDSAGNESQPSSALPLPAAGGGNGVNESGKGGGHSGPCFIATAAYGSYLDPHVEALRKFRDDYLLTNAPGKAFVSLYYHCSPPIADFIGKHESLRSMTRWTLTPVIYLAGYPIMLLFMVAGTLLVLIAGCGYFIRNK